MLELVGIVRAVHVAASLSLFGTLLFRAAIAPAALERATPDARRRLDLQLNRLAVGSLLVVLIAAAAWLPLQAAAMSGAGNASEVLRAVAPVLFRTQFGHVFLARIVLLVATVPCLIPRSAGRSAASLGTALSGAAVVLLAVVGHAAALEGDDRIVGTALLGVHLAAAGAWLGGLVPLALTLVLPPSAAAVAIRRFSPLGLSCVAALVLSAWFNGCALIGSVSALFGTPYGLWAVAKLALLAGMIVLAAANRFNFTRDLAFGSPKRATGWLRGSIALETALGLAAVLAAGQLAITPPAIHVQP